MANLSPQKRLILRLLLLLLLLSQPAGVVPQAPQQKPQQPPQGGVSTGGIYAPVRDALSRPITAGGFVDGAPVVFEDVTQRSGLGAFRNRTGTPEKNYILELATGGVALFDYDGDGWLDVYLVNGSTYAALKGLEPAPRAALFHNNHDGTFTDVTAKAGVSNDRWGFGVTVGDYNNDGWPDLYVTNFGKNCLYRNNGDGTFTEVAEKAGVSDPNGYYGFAAAWVDVDDDGWPDLLVANDSTPNYLYRNRGDGTFEDVSLASGFALNENGREQASMGIAVGDYDNDGRVDLYVTNFSDDYNSLYHNEGGGNFLDITFQLGLGEPTIPFLGWGTGFIDYDNDGRKDIFVANGHVYRSVDKTDWGTTWAQRPQLFRNLNGARFQEVPPATGSGLAVLASARGAAFGDIFNDGHIDVVMNNLDGPPTLLRNVVRNGNHWLLLKLIGGPKSPRDATGAVVSLTAGGLRQRGDVLGGGSYSSHSDQRLHFGLGTATQVEKLEIRWPSGLRESVSVPGVDRILTIVEGKGVVDDKKKDDKKADKKKDEKKR